MEYKIFYTCYETDNSVLADNPYVTDRDTMIATGQQVLRGDGDFIGVIDENGRTLQMMIDGLNDVRIEILEPSKRGSWARTASVRDIENELLSIVQPFDANTAKGMVFESW